jgi:N12 class adenine-specific DNA methylase
MAGGQSRRLTTAQAITDNLRALSVLTQNPTGPWTAPERRTLGEWHGWGAAPQLFDRPEWADQLAELRSLVGDAGVDAAARTTLNAHYTDPRLIADLWGIVSAAGPAGGVVLEPGCGRGDVLAAAPDGWAGIGVELDPTTASVARALVGDRHTIRTESFADTNLAAGRLGAVVGNVPFGQVQLHDPAHNADRKLSIHDHFLAKAAAGLAPGGIAAVITSHWTLDARTTAGREAIGAHADFLGAIRLPGIAHRAHAGTDVVTDIIVLRGRAAGADAVHAEGFLDAPRSLDPEGRVTTSRYFEFHEDHVAGVETIRSGQFGPELAVTCDSDVWHDVVGDALGHLTAALPAGPTGPVGAADPAEAIAGVAPAAGPVGRITATPTGLFRVRGVDGWEPLKVSKSAAAELRLLVAMRDTLEELVVLERGDAPDAGIAATRARLNDTWRSYVDRFGPINRQSRNAKGSVVRPRLAGFRNDPGFARVAALERYDETTDTATPASILQGRVLRPTVVATTADTPAEAVMVSLQQRGRLDTALIGELLGIDPDDVAGALGDHAFTDPATAALVPRAEYLSGNVRQRLAAARDAAAADPAYARNVEALEAVQPRDVTAAELHGLLGAPWIAREVVQQYAIDLADTPAANAQSVQVQYSAELGKWNLVVSTTVAAHCGGDHPYGTESRNALQLLEDGLNGRVPTVTRTVEERQVIDPEATELARECLGSVQDHFDQWALHDNPARSAELLEKYNTTFNSTVARDYSGYEVATPGLVEGFELRPHQHQAIARVLLDGNSLLAHPTGAGKTAEMIVAGQELRRLGLAKLPCFAVPNHMLEQFTKDHISLYPDREVLAVTKDDLTAGGRAAFAAKVASHDWDAVIVTHNTLTAWPQSPGVAADLLERRIAQIRHDIESVAGQGDGRTLTKLLEKRLANAEERAKSAQSKVGERQDGHDMPFDESGIDYLFVDELQEFKNGELHSSATRLRGVPSGDGSQKARALEDKLTHLREQHPGKAVFSGATATPIANTVAEMWIMGRYVRPDLLADLGMSTFDAFRAQFADTVTAMELDASGTRYRQVERLARYKNLPELARWWGDFVDVVHVEDLNLPTPAIAGGRRQVHMVPPHPDLEHYMRYEISKRADAIRDRRVERDEDNFLKLTSDCRMASFDWEGFSGEPVDDAYSSLASCADSVAATWAANKDRIYLDVDGNPHPRPGAFQLVFADLGTPKPGEETSYDRLKAKMVARGIPAEQIQFAHEHSQSDDAKARFFAACRDGRVAVAISSTAKMGVGTNVQTRLRAIDHIDTPWRPDFVEQRDGRGIRQGNQNDEVDIRVHGTERSFSVFGWQVLETKAGFIGQVMRTRPDGPRSIEIGDDEALSYGQVKALATGDDDFLRAAELEHDLARLERLARAHGRDTQSAANRANRLDSRLALTTTRHEAQAPVVERIGRLDPDRQWRLEVKGQVHTNRADAARAIEDLTRYKSHTIEVGELPDERLTIRFVPIGTKAGTYRLVDTTTGADTRLSAVVDDRYNLGENVGALTRLSNLVERLADSHADDTAQLQELPDRIAAARASAEAPFVHAADLVDVRHQVTQIHQTLSDRYAADTANDDRTPGPSTPAAADPSRRTSTDPSPVRALVDRLPPPPSPPSVPPTPPSPGPQIGM